MAESADNDLEMRSVSTQVTDEENKWLVSEPKALTKRNLGYQTCCFGKGKNGEAKYFLGPHCKKNIICLICLQYP